MPPLGMMTSGLHNPCWDYGGSDHLERKHLQLPPAPTGMLVLWGSKEKGWGALFSVLGCCSAPSRAFALQGVCGSLREAVGGSRGVFFSFCTSSFPDCSWLQSPAHRANAGAAAESEYGCGGFEQPTPKPWG